MAQGIRYPRRWQSAMLSMAFSLYSLALLAGPFLHHDFACHLKSRTHCTTCAFSLSANGVEVQSSSPAAHLPDAGGLPSATSIDLGSPVLTCPRDRSPPA